MYPCVSVCVCVLMCMRACVSQKKKGRPGKINEGVAAPKQPEGVTLCICMYMCLYTRMSVSVRINECMY